MCGGVRAEMLGERRWAPGHCRTGPGEGEAGGILPEKLLVKCPPITITDRAALEASPKGIRPDGYGYSVGERVVRSGPMGRNAPILADIMRV